MKSSEAIYPGNRIPASLNMLRVYELDCLRLHFVRFEGSMIWKQAAKSELKLLNFKMGFFGAETTLRSSFTVLENNTDYLKRTKIEIKLKIRIIQIQSIRFFKIVGQQKSGPPQPVGVGCWRTRRTPLPCGPANAILLLLSRCCSSLRTHYPS